MAKHSDHPFEQSVKAPWWPPLVAFALIPGLIVLGIALAALGASDAVVVGVIVGPLVLAGLGAFVLALCALAYMPYAAWRESRRRGSSVTPRTRPSIHPEPRPSSS